MNRTVEIYGKSEFVSAANKYMQRALAFYAKGMDEAGDENAQQAEKFFATAARVNFGGYSKVLVGLIVR